MGMEGTLSARPGSVVVSADGRFIRGAAPNCQGRASICKPKDALLVAGAALLVSFAAAAHFTEPVPSALAPICAALSALIVGIFWRSQWMNFREAAEEPNFLATDGAGDDEALITWTGPARAQPNPRLAVELAKAAALAQLTAKISHELRTPLNAVIGFSELMSREAFGPLGSQRYQNYAEHILACGQTLLKSAEDTLAITSALAEPMQADGAASQPLALNKLLSEACDSLASQLLGRELPVEWDVPNEVVLCGDIRVLRQVFINLMQEAVTRSCGELPVLVQGTLEGQTVKLEFAAQQGCSGGGMNDSLAVSVARALSDLHGMCLETRLDDAGCWRAVVVLERVLQKDFFGSECVHGHEAKRMAA